MRSQVLYLMVHDKDTNEVNSYGANIVGSQLAFLKHPVRYTYVRPGISSYIAGKNSVF